MDFSQFELSLNEVAADEPVFVKEALINLDISGLSSEVVGLCDWWAWLVCGRSVYIWNWASNITSSYSIQLAPSGLKYNSDLIAVYSLKGDVCACLCVSPEGVIRHWNNAALGQHFSETLVDLKSQVAHSIIHLKGDTNTCKFLLTTSTCSLFVITIPNSAAQKVCVEALSQPGSVISGIGRRMSSLLFSRTQSAQSELKLIRCISLDNFCVVISSKGAQAWNMNDWSIVWMADMNKQLKDAALQAFYNSRIPETAGDVNVEIVDATKFGNGVVLLVQVVNNQWTTRERLFIGFIERVDVMPSEPLWVMPVPQNQVSDGVQNSTRIFELFCGRNAGILLVQRVGCTWMHVPIGAQDLVQSKINYHLKFEEEFMMGTGITPNGCLVFLQNSGLQYVKLLPKGLSSSSVMDVSRMAEENSNRNDEKIEDAQSRLQNAFLMFARHHLTEACDELSSLVSDVGGGMGLVVLGLARDILDDAPAADPRWKRESQNAVMRENSLNLIYQLEGKRKTLDLLITFITTVDLWNQMSDFETIGGRQIQIRTAIQELNEKLEAAIALQAQPMRELQSLLDETYDVCIDKRQINLDANLSPADYFFTHISKFDDFLCNLVDCLNIEMKTLDDSSDKAWILCNVTNLVLDIMQTISAMTKPERTEKSWFLSGNSENCFNQLIIQCLDCLSDIVSTAERGRVAEKVLLLSQVLLAENEISLHNSAISKGEFEDLKESLIDNLINIDQLERATSLAERFVHFPSLVKLVELRYSRDTVTQQQVFNDYKRKYEKFAQFLYSHYLEIGEPEKVLKDNESGTGEDLNEFLGQHPNLYWVHHLKNHNFEEACRTLLDLANKENESVAAQKTLLSLCKLSSLAANGLKTCTELIDERLHIINAQINIDERLIQGKPYTKETMPPLTVDDILQIYCSETDLDECWLGRVLSILDRVARDVNGRLPLAPIYQSHPIRLRQLRLTIWITVILNDDWPAILNSSNMQLAAAESLFGRAVSKICKEGGDFSGDLLPVSEDVLQCSELGNLSGNPKFQYIIRAAEETAKKHLSDSQL